MKERYENKNMHAVSLCPSSSVAGSCLERRQLIAAFWHLRPGPL